MKFRHIFAACVISVASVDAAHAMQLKGLTLGESYTNSDLKRVFGSATCEPFGIYSLCKVPTTFWGQETNLLIMRNKDNRIMSIEAYLDLKYRENVRERLQKQYGEPSYIRDVGVYWYNVENGTITVGLEAGPYKTTVRYLYADLMKMTSPNYKAPLDFSDQ